VAYVLESAFGLTLPRQMQVDVARLVQRVADDDGGELSADRLRELFREYVEAAERDAGPGSALPHQEVSRR
jgi:2-isopropylmalate synthase